MASEIKVNKISPESGTTLTLGDSGDTINFGTGVLPNFENLTVTGDLTVDTNSLKVDSTNNFVGIGTASPSVALDVVGAITATGNITGTLATAAQPNITSVGTLTGLTVSGNIAGTLTTAAQTNITSVGTLTSFSSTGIDDNATSTAITIDSSQNVGIDNTIPGSFNSSANQLVVGSGSGQNGITIYSGTSNNGSIHFGDGTGASSYRGSINYYHNGDTLGFNVGASEGMRLTSTGLGIGTSSPESALDVGTGTITQRESSVRNTISSSATGFEFIANATSLNVTRNFVFKGSTSGGGVNERMRISTNGDISFYEDSGTTAKFFWDASTERLGIGTTSPVTPLQVNRDISGVTDALSLRANSNVTNEYIGLNFAKATHGRMSGIYGRNENNGNADGRLYFYTNSGGTYSTKLGITSTGIIFPGSDNTQDLGTSGSRFNDIYLGGGLYVGGTGSANKLDDYEEGTWTPNIGGNATYSAQAGHYRKIGNMVFANFQIQINVKGTGNNSQLQGFPFTSSANTSVNVQSGYTSYFANLAINVDSLAFYVERNATTAEFVATTSSTTNTVDNGAGVFGDNAHIYGAIVYAVD